MISNLFNNNQNLFGQLTSQDFRYFIELIKVHGKYPEFLDFYETILDTTEKQSNSSDLQKLVIQNIFDSENFDDLDVLILCLSFLALYLS
jgi:inositol 1,4,5-triphosphate receptor type 3